LVRFLSFRIIAGIVASFSLGTFLLALAALTNPDPRLHSPTTAGLGVLTILAGSVAARRLRRAAAGAEWALLIWGGALVATYVALFTGFAADPQADKVAVALRVGLGLFGLLLALAALHVRRRRTAQPN
jgi:hypothetical protein